MLLPQSGGSLLKWFWHSITATRVLTKPVKGDLTALPGCSSFHTTASLRLAQLLLQHPSSPCCNPSQDCLLLLVLDRGLEWAFRNGFWYYRLDVHSEEESKTSTGQQEMPHSLRWERHLPNETQMDFSPRILCPAQEDGPDCQRTSTMKHIALKYNHAVNYSEHWGQTEVMHPYVILTDFIILSCILPWKWICQVLSILQHHTTDHQK